MNLTPSRRPTLRDVAERAGVSFKTVSRVVNGEGGVSPDLAGRVELAIHSLGYRPDDRARNLRRSRAQTGTIGFVLVDVANPFFSSILRGIEEVAQTHGYLVLSGSSDSDPARQDELVDAFVARRVDGLIAVPSGPKLGQLEHELDRGTPVVFVDIDPRRAAVDLVRSDHFGGAVLATEHLIAHGHRDIAFVGDDPTDVFSAQLRLEGYCEAMRRAGLEVAAPGRTVTGHLHPDGWRDVILRLLGSPERPTAMFTAQNFVTVGAVRALHELGLHERIAHVGFDDVELADVVRPGISVVPQQPRHLGRRAAELLFRRIEGIRSPPTQEVIGSSLIARGSGEIAPLP